MAATLVINLKKVTHKGLSNSVKANVGIAGSACIFIPLLGMYVCLFFGNFIYIMCIW